MYHKCLPKSTIKFHFVTIVQKGRGEIVKDKWTGDAAAIMHVHEISALALAEELGWNPKYLSTVLNCKRRPKNAESLVMDALHNIVAREVS